MKEDYLWDRTGEPDPEIAHLEEVLGTLRYQPRPLEIPASIQTRRKLFPIFAMAATIAMLLLAAGVWLKLQRQPTPTIAEKTAPPREVPKFLPSPPQQVRQPSQKPRDNVPRARKRRTIAPPAAVAENKKPRRNRRLDLQDRNLTAADRAQAELAKEQLMLALRLASSKLNLAQKKVQDLPPANVIRNQHKVG